MVAIFKHVWGQIAQSETASFWKMERLEDLSGPMCGLLRFNGVICFEPLVPATLQGVNLFETS
jgi:hypothetical protein